MSYTPESRLKVHEHIQKTKEKRENSGYVHLSITYLGMWCAWQTAVWRGSSVLSWTQNYSFKDAWKKQLYYFTLISFKIKSNLINIRLIRWQDTTTITDAKVVYINTMLFDCVWQSWLVWLSWLCGRADCYHMRPQVADSGTVSRYRG